MRQRRTALPLPAGAENTAVDRRDCDQTEQVPDLRHHLALTGALLTCAVLVATVWAWASDEAGPEVTAFSEHRLPPLIALGLVITAAVVPLGIMASSDDIAGVVGLTLAGSAALVPLWSAWPDLDARWRALALAAGPLAVAGLALVARSWAGASVAAAAGLLHALAYDPFRDVGCARVCLEVRAVLTMPTIRLTFLVAVGLALAAALALRSALHRRGLHVLAAAGAIVLAAIGVVRWRTTGDPDAYAAARARRRPGSRSRGAARCCGPDSRGASTPRGTPARA